MGPELFLVASFILSRGRDLIGIFILLILFILRPIELDSVWQAPPFQGVRPLRTARTAVDPIFSAQASGRAQGSASASMGSAP